ncbi:MAG: hypothetical protein ABDK93_06185, partial [Atribacterota bacterium]
MHADYHLRGTGALAALVFCGGEPATHKAKEIGSGFCFSGFWKVLSGGYGFVFIDRLRPLSQNEVGQERILLILEGWLKKALL